MLEAQTVRLGGGAPEARAVNEVQASSQRKIRLTA
jgi:hypothetical protein